MKKLLITMLALMLAVTCCSCSPKTAPDTPKPNSDNPTLIVDPTDDAALSTTTFFFSREQHGFYDRNHDCYHKCDGYHEATDHIGDR